MEQNKAALLNYVQLDSWPILRQLRLEEALLRADNLNWCIVNRGSPPAIVMGISGNPSKLINIKRLEANPVPLIKRFSGGGTVFIDKDTFFVTFIFNTACVGIACYPEEVFNWSVGIYENVFKNVPFKALENDYVVENRKCGGNAQYFRKNRWLHHTSFLWDYQAKNMDYLLHPLKTPKYRQERKHEDFLHRLNVFFESQDQIGKNLLQELSNRYTVKKIPSIEVIKIVERPHRQVTELISE